MKNTGKKGRPKGAVGCVAVKLADINAVLNQDHSIPVNRRFAEMLKLRGEAIVATTQQLRSMANPVAVVVHDLEKENAAATCGN